MHSDLMLRRLEMYSMIMAIENDIIEYFKQKLSIQQIPPNIIDRVAAGIDRNDLHELLHGLDLQAYIEIINSCIVELGVKLSEKQFLNKEFKDIIQIRNKIMHPRPLGFYDYSILKTCFLSLEDTLPFIEWGNVRRQKTIIQDTPEKLFDLEYNLRKSENIIENLPTYADYEETSFIGRKREIGEIKEKLFKRHVHILSIIGDGGIGKTALVLKVLYDLLDDPNPGFELIIWVSLKTCELNNYEFKKIDNSINDIADMYSRISSFVGNSDSIPTPEYLIQLTKEFNTLFVLDNLETINTADIKDFLDQMSENAKIIITSRIGLGEIEHRYYLNGMSDDDVLEYFNALLELYGYSDMFSNEEKIRIAKTELYSNPLTIKWFVRSLRQGQPYIDILNHKNDIINYCMSNVYEKLSHEAHEILRTLIIANSDLNYAEIMYYLDKNVNDDIIVRRAINDLAKCNFVNKEKVKNGYVLVINTLAKAFLKLSDIHQSFRLILGERQRRLTIFKQNMLSNINVSPYSIRTFDLTDNNTSRCVSAYYLNHALDCFYNGDFDDAIDYVNFAKLLSPNYFECNKVAAFFFSKTNIEKAREEFDIALSNCLSQNEEKRILILYAGFLLRINDYQGALSLYVRAGNIDPNNFYVKCEKIKIYSCIGDFKNAETESETIDIAALLTHKDKNIFLTRKADILRKRAEKLQQRDLEKKLEYLTQAFDIIDSSESPDKALFDFIVKILLDLTFICFDTKVMTLFAAKLKKYSGKFKGSKRYNELCKWIRENYKSIPDVDNNPELREYLADSISLENLPENQGVVYSLKDYYGFIRNLQHPNGIYFARIGGASNAKIGDIVQFKEISNNTRGPAATISRIIVRLIDT